MKTSFNRIRDAASSATCIYFDEAGYIAGVSIASAMPPLVRPKVRHSALGTATSFNRIRDAASSATKSA